MADNRNENVRLGLATIDGVLTPGAKPRARRPKAPAPAVASTAPKVSLSEEAIDDFKLRLFLQIEKDLMQATALVVSLGATGNEDAKRAVDAEEKRKTLVGLAAHLYPKTVEDFKSKARMATAHPALFGSLMADLLDQRHGDC